MPFGGQAIEAGKAYIKFLVDDSAVNGKLSKISRSLTSMGKTGLAATAPLFGAFAAASVTFAKFGSELADISLRTGFSAEALSELKFAADQNGTSLGAVERAAKKMQAGIVAAGQGTGGLADAIKILGVDLNALRSQSPEQQFETLTRAISGVKDPTLKSALAQKVFGRSGVELLPILDQTGGGLDALRERARQLGLTVSNEAVAAADELGDQFDAAKAQVVALAFQVGAAIAGPLTGFLKWGQGAMAWMIDFVRTNPNVVAGVAAVTVAVAAASAGLVAFGTILSIISAHPILGVLTLIAGIVLAIATYFGLATDASAKFDESLSKLQKSTGVGATNAPALQAQSAQIQQQLQAAVQLPSAVPAGAQSAAMSGVSPAMQSVLEGIEKNTDKALPLLLRIVTNTANGGLLVGPG